MDGKNYNMEYMDNNFIRILKNYNMDGKFRILKKQDNFNRDGQIRILKNRNNFNTDGKIRILKKRDNHYVKDMENNYIYRVPQKKCPIAIFSLNLFQRSDYTFSHVFRN